MFKFCKYQPFLANVKCFSPRPCVNSWLCQALQFSGKPPKNWPSYVSWRFMIVLGVWSVLETTVTTPWAHKLGNSLGSWDCQVLVSKKAGWKKRNWLTESRGLIALSGRFRLLAPSEVASVYHSFYVWHCLAMSWAQKSPAARLWQDRARLQDLDRTCSQALASEGLAAKRQKGPWVQNRYRIRPRHPWTQIHFDFVTYGFDIMMTFESPFMPLPVIGARVVVWL